MLLLYVLRALYGLPLVPEGYVTTCKKQEKKTRTHLSVAMLGRFDFLFRDACPAARLSGLLNNL
jgi:hypothetical protein